MWGRPVSDVPQAVALARRPDELAAGPTLNLLKRTEALAAAPPQAAGGAQQAHRRRGAAKQHLDEQPLFGNAEADVELLDRLPHIKRLVALQARAHLAM